MSFPSYSHNIPRAASVSSGTSDEPKSDSGEINTDALEAAALRAAAGNVQKRKRTRIAPGASGAALSSSRLQQVFAPAVIRNIVIKGLTEFEFYYLLEEAAAMVVDVGAEKTKFESREQRGEHLWDAFHTDTAGPLIAAVEGLEAEVKDFSKTRLEIPKDRVGKLNEKIEEAFSTLRVNVHNLWQVSDKLKDKLEVAFWTEFNSQFHQIDKERLTPMEWAEQTDLVSGNAHKVTDRVVNDAKKSVAIPEASFDQLHEVIGELPFMLSRIRTQLSKLEIAEI